MDRLIIRLARKASQKNYWLLWSDSTNTVIDSGEIDNAEQLNQLTEKARQSIVTCLLPGIDVAIRDIPITGSFNRQMQQALPYLAEDELAADVESLHFSVFAKQPGLVHVAICEKQKIAMWLDWLEEAQITCRQFIPEGLTLPVVEQRWQAVQLDNQWIVREDDNTAWSCEQEMLDIVLASKSEDGVIVHIDSYTPSIGSHAVQWTDLPPLQPMALFAKGLQNNKINMLTGEFKPSKKHNKQLEKWRMPLILAVSLFILLMFNLHFKNLQIEKQTLQVKQQVESVYKQAFPLQSPLKYARIKKKLKSMLVGLEGDVDSGFLSMLNGLVPAFAKNPQLEITNIKFDGQKQEMRLSANASNFQSFEKFNAAVGEHFNVEQGALSSSKDRVSGLLTIRIKQ